MGEAYTSKGCPWCFRCTEGLGGSDTFICATPGCGRVCDRDMGASATIFVKHMRL